MDRIIVENVRCFRERQEVPLAPLTLLVGENSSGKSTFLSMARIAWDLASGKEPLFNEEPFLLGAYDQIATACRNRGASKSFLIGWGQDLAVDAQVRGEFVSYESQPALKDWRFEAPPFSLTAEYGMEEKLISLRAEAPSGVETIEAKSLGFHPGRMRPSWMASLTGSEGEISEKDQQKLLRLAFAWEKQMGLRPYAFAPIRTRPLRTYDPVKEVVDPEGGHVPMLLARIQARDKKRWLELRRVLDEFGENSGLFRKVDVRRLGENSGDPFQLQVVIDGAAVNLVDVGYGVSQILPVIVDCLRGDPEGMFLLQQPEVHLHPKAQAALGSFLAYLAVSERKRFLVETHSDYVLDRIRMDLRDGKHGLKPEDVLVLYFEREAGNARIHQITFDEHGNIQNAPPGYRSFFLQEERRFLGG